MLPCFKNNVKMWPLTQKCDRQCEETLKHFANIWKRFPNASEWFLNGFQPFQAPLNNIANVLKCIWNALKFIPVFENVLWMKTGSTLFPFIPVFLNRVTISLWMTVINFITGEKWRCIMADMKVENRVPWKQRSSRYLGPKNWTQRPPKFYQWYFGHNVSLWSVLQMEDQFFQSRVFSCIKRQH